MTDKFDIVVIGAGAAGLLAAGRAAEYGASVLLLEKMEQPGKKILISGKTRCNLTNICGLEDFIHAYGPNGRFLYGVFHRFFREELLELLRKYGVETKSERGGRIFPASDHSEDVVAALLRFVSDNKAVIQTRTRVSAIRTQDGHVTGVQTEKGLISCDCVVLAAGGASWPATGSTGDGYRIAEALGHTIVKLRPGLVPLVVEEVDLAKSMQGVSLKNICLTAYQGRSESLDEPKAWKRIIDFRQGEMMFTHFGIGGPVTFIVESGYCGCP